MFYFLRNSDALDWKFELLNSEIVGNYKTNENPELKVINIKDNTANNIDSDFTEDKVVVFRTKFIDNKYGDCDFFENNGTCFRFDQCLVQSNTLNRFLNSTTSQVHVYNSTFDDNDCNEFLFYCPVNGNNYSKGDGVILRNNTIVNNDNKTSLFEGCYSKVTIQNNTIVGNSNKNYLFQRLGSNSTCTGNLMYGNINKLGQFDNFGVVKASYNVMELDTLPENNLILDKTNIIVDDNFYSKSSNYKTVDFTSFKNYYLSEVKNLMEGTYSSRYGIFYPDLEYKEGFTPVAVLKKDILLDGTYIRLPKLEDVSLDQRGATRMDMTCMGAYEMGCTKDTVNATDTITVGTKFKDGKVYKQIGIYKNINRKYTSSIGCDSIVNYTLFVVPDPKVKEYYVKTKVTGTGDGSDWDNAMSPKDFAFVFNNSTVEGITYYLAAGVYYPVYNGLGDEKNDRNAYWSAKHGANIYGGFDSLATGDASTTKADPSLYRTIFSGDFNNDDEIVVNEDGSYYINNLADNVNYNLLTMDITEDVHISGVEFRGMTYSRGTSPAVVYIHSSENSKANVLIDYCKFSTADKGVNVYSVGDVKIDNCEFDHLLNSAIGVEGNTYVSNSTFNYTNGINFDGTTSEFTLENSTFTNNTTHLTLSYGYSSEPLNVKAKISNNTFINGVKSGCIFVYDPIDAEFTGNIFAGSAISVFETSKETSKQTFTNNLFAYKSLDLGKTGSEKNNITLEDATELYTAILDGTYSAEDAVFTPNLANNDGYTRTVALLDDKLSTGEELRLPYDANLGTDQRGVSRLPMTSMGAYEFRCKLDTTFVNDTIFVGTKPSFKDSIYGVVGIYEGIFENLESNGCDSVVNHTLVVKPESSIKEYYVTNTYDEGEGSLRYAVEYAKLSDADTFRIKFAFKEKGPHVININNYIFIKRDNLIIDGSDVSDSIIVDGGGNDYPGLRISCSINFDIESICFKNCNTGIDLIGTEAKIINCDVIENQIGISSSHSSVLIEKCLVSGNSSYGIQTSNPMIGGTDRRCSRSGSKVMIKNCIIGLNRNEDTAYPNKIGIFSYNDGGDSIINNVISGNIEDGILLYPTSRSTILSNYIGINRNEECFGNGGNGIYYDFYGNTGGTIYYGDEDLANANIIGCNGKYGMSTTDAGGLYVKANYIGITPDGKNIGNKLGGLYGGSLYIDGSVVSCNGGDGILTTKSYTYVKNCIIGDKESPENGNEGYGIHVLSSGVVSDNNVIWNNSLGGVYYEGSTGYPISKIDASQNLFGGNQPIAIESKNETLNIPTISKIERDGNVYKVYGHVDFIDGTPFNDNQYYSVDSTKIGIELFKNQGDKETAHSYIGYVESDENGDWEMEVDDSFLDENALCVSATAIHIVLGPPGQYVEHQIEKYTSGLSDPFCCLECLGCKKDTTFVTDTIVVGTEFMDSVYTEIGRHDSIIKVYKSKIDCDSVVNYTLFVTPDPNVLNYYVKTKRTGKGDGSDWDNAMSGEDFTFSLPYAPSGATFYVAEGTYKPIYTYTTPTSVKTYVSDYEIKNDVTIRGGYSAEATTKKALYDPKKYPTIFDRDDIRYSLFVTYSKDELHIVLDGVSVINSGTAFYLMNPDKKLKISNSKFSNNGSCVYMPSSGDELEVFNSEFTKHTSTVIEMPQASVLIMDSVLFDNNAKRLINIPTTSGVNPGYNVKLNRLFAYSNGDSSEIINSIGHDFLLTNSEFKHNNGMFYILDNTRIDSTVFENNYGSITKYGVLGFEINECSFVDNNCKGSFIYTAKNGEEFNHFSVTNSSFKNIDSKGLCNFNLEVQH